MAACQDLYLSTMLFFLPATTDASGKASVYLGAFPYQSSLAGLKITAQAAYNNSANNSFQLTQASESTVAMQPGAYSFNRVYYWATPALAKQGTFGDHTTQPVFRYRYQ